MESSSLLDNIHLMEVNLYIPITHRYVKFVYSPMLFGIEPESLLFLNILQEVTSCYILSFRIIKEAWVDFKKKINILAYRTLKGFKF